MTENYLDIENQNIIELVRQQLMQIIANDKKPTRIVFGDKH
jgi:hypothetical protein